MARETRAVWADRIGRWRRSGLTAARFAAREGINPRTLTFWKWKLGRVATDHPASDGSRDPRRAGAGGFVEVLRAAASPAASVPACEVILPDGYRIGVVPGFDSATLRAVLDVLEGRR
jgi:transposase